MSHKRLIVACDGTWVDSDNGFVRDSWLPWNTSGHLATPSNVTRICRALRPRSEDGEIPQVVYYQAGLGSRNDWYSFFIGGYLGDGIAENIREAYAFLCNNYEDGDEIILIGFSRGAFTARSIGGLIGAIGLLTRKGLENFYSIFRDWENQVNPNYKPQFGTPEWPTTRPKFGDSSYIPKLAETGLTRPSIPVKAIGVWDTVGTLGVPEVKFLWFTLFAKQRTQYSFINAEVPANVEYAYHALALDEQRKSFSATLWESPKPGTASQLKELKQCWFPGVHTSVGGGFQDTSTSDITLAWMITQLSNHLSFNPNYVLEQRKENEEFYKDTNVPVCSWAMGLITRSDGGLLNTILGRQVRTPGDNYATDPTTGKAMNRKLTDTCEFMHPSVCYRIKEKGPGLANSAKDPPNGIYQPKALQGWTYYPPGKPWRGAKLVHVRDEAEKWDQYGKWIKSGCTVYIVEEKIEKDAEEMKLVESWPGVAAKVLD